MILVLLMAGVVHAASDDFKFAMNPVTGELDMVQDVSTFGGSANGNFTGLNLDGDSGTAQDLTNQDTINIVGGTNVSTVVGATDTVTVNLDSDVVLNDLTVTGIIDGDVDSDNVVLHTTAGVDRTLTDYINTMQSAGYVMGGDFTDGGSGNASISAGVGFIKTSDAVGASSLGIEWSADTALALVDNATNYIYIDYNSGTPIVKASTTNPTDFRTIIHLGKIYRDGTDLHLFKAGAYIPEVSTSSIKRWISQFGEVALTSGGVVAETGERYLTVSAAKLYGGVVPVVTSSVDTSGADTFTQYYTDGAGGWNESEVSQINNSQYNNGGTLTNLSNNRHRTDFAYLDNDGHLMIIFGTNNDYFLSDAQEEPVPSSVPDIVAQFSTLIAKIIVKEGETNLEEIDNLETGATFSSSGTVVHNELASIQGGTADEYYHLTSAEHTVVQATSGANTGDQTITLTGEVTGSGTGSFAATVADNIIDEANLKVNTPTNDYVLTADSGEAGGMKWAEAASGGSSVWTETVDGAYLSGDVSIDGMLSVNDNAFFCSDVDIDGDLSIGAELTVDDVVYMIGNTISADNSDNDFYITFDGTTENIKFAETVSEIQADLSIGGNLTVTNNLQFDDGEANLFYDTVNQTNDSLILGMSTGVSQSGTLIMCQKGDEGIDFAEGDHHNPRLTIAGSGRSEDVDSYITFNVNDEDNACVSGGNKLNFFSGDATFSFGGAIVSNAQVVHIYDGGSDNKPGALALYSDAGADNYIFCDTNNVPKFYTSYPTDDDTEGIQLSLGYTLYGQATNTTAALAESTTYYMGSLPTALSTGITAKRIYIPRAGKITRVQVFGASAAHPDYDSTVFVRLNNTTNTTVATDFNFAAYVALADNYTMDITVAAGDYVTIGWTTPAWGASGTTYTSLSATIYVE